MELQQCYLPSFAFRNEQQLVLENECLYVTKVGLVLLHDHLDAHAVKPMTFSGSHRFHYLFLKKGHVLPLP